MDSEDFKINKEVMMLSQGIEELASTSSKQLDLLYKEDTLPISSKLCIAKKVLGYGYRVLDI